jgi:hypothetical protein
MIILNELIRLERLPCFEDKGTDNDGLWSSMRMDDELGCIRNHALFTATAFEKVAW